MLGFSFDYFWSQYYSFKMFCPKNLAASSSSASLLALLDFTPLVGFVGLGLWEIKLPEFVKDFLGT